MPTEIEIKLQLAPEGHAKVMELLKEREKGGCIRMENFFWDGEAGEMRQARRVVRLRKCWRDDDSVYYVLTIKSKGKVVDGVGNSQEDECDISEEGAALLFQSGTFEDSCPLGQALLQSTGVSRLYLLGSFYNERHVYTWTDNIHKLELDQSKFSAGLTLHEWEMECDSQMVDSLKKDITAFLSTHAITWKESTQSKFATFLSTLP